MEKSYSFIHIVAGDSNVAVSSMLASSKAFNPDAVTVRLKFDTIEISVTFDTEAAFTSWYDQLDREWRIVSDATMERNAARKSAERVARLQLEANETFTA